MKHRGIVAIVFILGCARGSVAAQLVVRPSGPAHRQRGGSTSARPSAQKQKQGTTSGLNRLGAEG
jgi:hypothetical protein